VAEPIETTVLRDLDEAIRGMRRLAIRPPEVAITLPGSPHRFDLAKLLACSAIGGLCGTANRDEPVTIKNLAQTLDLDHSTVSRVLSEVESDGLVTRTPHPSDRRSSVLSLTPLGETVIAGFDQARLDFLGHMLEDWSVEDVDKLAELLSRFVDTASARKGHMIEAMTQAGRALTPTASPDDQSSSEPVSTIAE